MAITPSAVQTIIDNEAQALRRALDERTGSNCGVAVAFCYPADPSIPAFYSYGPANSAGYPVTEATVFGIGSVTKTFTATLLANVVLIPGSTITLEDKVTKYLPTQVQSNQTLQEISLCELATHTSGMSDSVTSVGNDAGVDLFLRDPSEPPSDLLDFWQTYTGPQPGSCWLYSDLGFITLGYAMVAANSAYRCYADLLADVITGPLGMPSTAATIPDGATVVQGHYNKELVPVTGAADLKSSAKDMNTWMLQHLQAVAANNPSQLQKALRMTTSLQQASTTVCGQTSTGPNMGLAWQIENSASGPTIVWKDGAVSRGGCSCWLGMILPGGSADPMGVAILTNGYVDEPQEKRQMVIADPYGRAILNQIAQLGS